MSTFQSEEVDACRFQEARELEPREQGSCLVRKPRLASQNLGGLYPESKASGLERAGYTT